MASLATCLAPCQKKKSSHLTGIFGATLFSTSRRGNPDVCVCVFCPLLHPLLSGSIHHSREDEMRWEEKKKKKRYWKAPTKETSSGIMSKPLTKIRVIRLELSYWRLKPVYVAGKTFPTTNGGGMQSGEAQLEHAHVACMFFARLAPTCMLSR